MNGQKELHYNTVVFISFENHYAPCGGLAVVMKNLPPIMSKSVKSVLISPLFVNIRKTREAIESNKLISTDLRSQILYRGYKHDISLYKSIEFAEYDNYQLYLVKPSSYQDVKEENPNSLNAWKKRIARIRGNLSNDGLFVGS